MLIIKNKNLATGCGLPQEIPLNILVVCVSQLLSLNDQEDRSGHSFGVENIAPTISCASAFPQNPAIGKVITNALEMLNTPAQKKKINQYNTS